MHHKNYSTTRTVPHRLLLSNKIKPPKISFSTASLFWQENVFVYLRQRVPETKSSIRIFLPKSLSFSSPSTRPLILVEWKAIFESRRGDSLGLGARFGQKTALSFINLACVWTTKIPFEKVTMCGPPSL